MRNRAVCSLENEEVRKENNFMSVSIEASANRKRKKMF